SLRVAADHARTLAVMIGDGVLPSNVGRGYVVRRILRRGSRHGVLLGIEEPFLCRVADAAIDEMGAAYPDLVERRDFILDQIERDESRFLTTLSKGLALLEEEIAQARQRGDKILAGETVFKLYDTFGFPLDLTEDILHGKEMEVDRSAFDSAMQAQRERARAVWAGSGDKAVSEIYDQMAADVSSQFRGYESLSGQSRVVALLVDGEPADVARQGQAVELICEETPFYAESGGQVGDIGAITTQTSRVVVSDTQKPVDGLFVHVGKVAEGEIRVDTEALLQVDEESRRATVRNHSGTHLLHAALREVLGPQAMQKGSLVGPDRLRFDFTHDAPLSGEEIERIEDLANTWIEENAPATTRIMNYDDAVSAGAVAIFGEKYGDDVRVVAFGDHSTELCGGTHARATGDIGLLKVISESGIAAGIRRIEALTGLGALEHIRGQEALARRATGILKVPLADLPERLEKLLAERRELEQQLEDSKHAQRGDLAGDLVSQAQDVEGAKVLAARVEGVDAKAMRGLVDDLRNRLGPSVVLLVAESQDKVLLAVGVTQDMVQRFKAGDLIREVAEVVGGGGGGRPDFAQAGGRNPDGIPDAIEKFRALCGVA
ncbi:MAG: alanine--tRNA ligase, partial [Myxococcota bacterium]